MKKLSLTLVAVIAGYCSYAQTNTFPTTGNVGIGTTTPRALLEVTHDSLTNSWIFMSNTGRFGSTLKIGSVISDGRQESQIQYQNTFGIWDANALTIPRIYIDPNGNIGLGTSTPGKPLTIQADVADLRLQAAANTAYNTDIVNNYNAAYPFYINVNQYGRIGFKQLGFASPDGSAAFISGYYGIAFATSTTDPTAGSSTIKMAILQNGNVLVGKTSQANTTYKLDVNGNARANAVVVNTTGADFVFDPAYKLFPLSDLDKYIQNNHHLPEIPSAAQMQKEGLNVGENQVKLLQKIEELTLYLIGKDTQIKSDESKIKADEDKLKAQEERISKLECEVQLLLKKGN